MDTTTGTVTIKPFNNERIRIRITGTAPYVQNNFSEKSRQKMKETQMAGSTARKSRAKEAKDFDAGYLGAMHMSTEGWHGIPAAAFRAACIDVCRIVGFKMTMAKMSIFVEADGFDAVDGTPLVRIGSVNGPEPAEHAVRNATGVADIRVRPMWREWWVDLNMRYDADQFTRDDVVNLLERAGQQVGVGEGRPFSKNSAGMGWGMFSTVTGA